MIGMPSFTQDQDPHHHAVARSVSLSSKDVSVQVRNAVDRISHVLKGGESEPENSQPGDTPQPPAHECRNHGMQM